MRLFLAALAAGPLLFAQQAAAQGHHFSSYGQNPDWPCAQRLVEHLEAGAYWAGPIQPDSGWRNDQSLFELVTGLTDRSIADDDALAKLAAYADTVPQGARAARLPMVFAALVDQTNDERTPLIARLEQLGRRQRGMGDTIAALSTKLDAMPADDPKRADLSGERDFDVRAFQQTQHTMRYACEAPSAMERRLGAFARALQSKLHP